MALNTRPTRRLGLLLAVFLTLVVAQPATAAEPGGYEHFHTYSEMKDSIDATVAAHPAIAQRFSMGQSYEGRAIWGVKISDNVGQDEAEPEVFFHGLTHARERLTTEMALYIVDTLTSGYGSDQRITDIVNGREVWIVPMLNPDGAEYDFSGGTFHTWRKNRQPIPGSSEIGVDLNRQFGYQWGCCGGSSSNPASDTYRGPEPWWAPEVQAYRDFIDSRVVDGRQQITSSIGWHTAGRKVLWPYGYTRTNVPPDMAYDDWRTFKALGQELASTNGYTPQQGADWYIVDGEQDDWAHQLYRIFTYTVEMKKGAVLRYYPTLAETEAELANNREAVLRFLEYADCPYRAAGLAATHCGPLNDDFEADRGWSFSADQPSGGWERAIPEASVTTAGTKQKATVSSGQADLVTGAAAGADPNANDIDGQTTALSPAFTLGPGEWRVKFRFTFAHDASATDADYLRLSVVQGASATKIWTVKGKASERNATWTAKMVSLNAWAGQTIRLRFTAVDATGDSLVEAAIENVRVSQTP